MNTRAIAVQLVCLHLHTLLHPADGCLPDETECPSSSDLDSDIFLSSSLLLPEVENRDLLSVPKGFTVQDSHIPGEGLGVFAQTFVPRRTWLAEYEGEVYTLAEEKNIKDFTFVWKVLRNGRFAYYIDAINSSTSNWVRYVGCARHVTEENVAQALCYGHLYFRSIRDIVPGEQLLVNCGDDYMKHLGIDLDKYNIL